MKNSFFKKRYAPLILMLAAIVFYFVALFDAHLKYGIEKALTFANKSDVSIEELSTSFRNAQLSLKNIQVCKTSSPTSNQLELAHFHADLSWSDLLKGNIVINNSKIEGISLNKARKEACELIPQLSSADGESAKEDSSDMDIESELKSLFAQEMPKFDESKINWKELPSAKQADKIKVKVDQLPSKWDSKVKNLANQDEIKKSQRELEKLNFGGNPQNILAAAKMGQEILSKSESDLKLASQVQNELKEDYTSVMNDIKSLDQLRKEDYKAIKSQIKIPDMNASKIGEMIFSPILQRYLKDFEPYYEIYKKYYPAVSGESNEVSAEAAAPQRTLRFKGKDFHFPSDSSPGFWLKNLQISASSGEESQDTLAGSLEHLSQSPEKVKKEAKVKLTGDLASSSVFGIDVNAESGFLKSPASHKIESKVASFPISEKELVNSSKIKLKIEKATGSTRIVSTSQDNLIVVQIESTFKDLKYKVSGEDAKVQGIVKSTLDSLDQVILKANAKGKSIHKLNWSISTNLDKAFQDSLGSELKKKAREKQKEIEAAIQKRLDEKKNSLLNLANSHKKSAENLITAKKSSLEGNKKTAENKLAQARSKQDQLKNQGAQQKNKAKKELKDKLKNKLKGFGI